MMKPSVLALLALTSLSFGPAPAGSLEGPQATAVIAGWTPVALETADITGIVSARPGLMYALAGGTGPRGFYASADGGRTWAVRGSLPDQYGMMQGLAVSPQGTILVHTDFSILRSRDGGAAFTRMWNAPQSFCALAPAGADAFAGVGYLENPETPVFMRSADGGSSWTTTRFGETGHWARRFSTSPSNPNLIYAVTRLFPHDGSSRVYRSRDGGATWLDVTGTIGTASPIRDVAADASVADRVWVAADSGLFRSDDQGDTWRSGSGLPAIHRVVSDPQNPGTVLAAGIGSLWRVRVAGDGFLVMPPATSLRGIPQVLLSLGSRAHLAGTAGILRSEDAAATWSWANRGLRSRTVTPMAISASSPSVAYAVVKGNGVYVSRDAGVTWRRLPDDPEARWFWKIVIDPANPNVVYGLRRYSSIMRSRDGGRTWTVLLTGDYLDFAVDPANPLRLAAGGWETYQGAPLIKTTLDGGASWRSSLLPGANYPVNAIAFGPRATIFAGGHYNPDTREDETDYGCLARSDDDGATWRKVHSRSLMRLATSPLRPSRIYAMNEDLEIRVSNNAGATWTRLPIVGTDGSSLWFYPWGWGVHLGTRDRILALSSRGMYSWQEGAGAWSRVAPGVQSGEFAWHPRSGLTLLMGWLGGTSDLFRRTDLYGR